MGGLDADLTYDIDISVAPVRGSRTSRTPVRPSTRPPTFVIAINNYRQSGGGNFPHVKAAPVVYNRTVEIRQLLIDWVTTNKVIDPPAFFSVDWRLTSGGDADHHHRLTGPGGIRRE